MPSLKEPHGLWGGLEAKLATAAQDDNFGLVLEQLLDVRWLDAGTVVGPGLVPVPSFPAARPELRVAKASETLDLDVPPSMGMHLRRAVGLDHNPKLPAHYLT